MTMFTANGILFGATRERLNGIMAPVCHYIHKAYKDWFRTQMPGLFKDEDIVSWIYYLRAIQSKRAPGKHLPLCAVVRRYGRIGTSDKFKQGVRRDGEGRTDRPLF